MNSDASVIANELIVFCSRALVSCIATDVDFRVSFNLFDGDLVILGE